MSIDKEIFNLIEKEENRQLNGIELIASENFTSPDVMKATGSVLTNKYAEGYPGKRYYGGCEVVDEIETIAINRAKELFGAAYANVQPHSGSQANTAVYHAFLNPGDKILGFDLSHGGHLTHGSPVNFSGRLYNPVFYGVNEITGELDYDNISEIALNEKPKLIIALSFIHEMIHAEIYRKMLSAAQLGNLNTNGWTIQQQIDFVNNLNDLSKKEDKKLEEMITSFIKIRGKDFTNIKDLIIK